MKQITKDIGDPFINVTLAEDRAYATMRDIAERLENIFVAIAFAEEGEA